MNAKVDYSQPIAFSDEGKLNVGALYEELLFDASNRGVTNLDYKRRTASTYLEFQTKFDKVNFILGGRAEDYKITGIIFGLTIVIPNYFHLFRRRKEISC